MMIYNMCSIVAFHSGFFLYFYLKIFWQKLASFLNKKRSPKQHGQGNFLEKFSKKPTL